MSHTSMVGQWVDVRRDDLGLPPVRGEVMTVNQEGALHVQVAFMWIEEKRKWEDRRHQRCNPIIVAHPGFSNICVLHDSENHEIDEIEVPDLEPYFPKKG